MESAWRGRRFGGVGRLQGQKGERENILVSFVSFSRARDASEENREIDEPWVIAFLPDVSRIVNLTDAPE